MENALNLGLGNTESVGTKKQGLGVYRKKIHAFTKQDQNDTQKGSIFGDSLFSNEQQKGVRMKSDGKSILACCCSFGGADNIKKLK
ncbi:MULTISPECIES: hypothetical protein [Lactobacillaceae]|uniref:hypothetical protein n=1 Tax=Lactobacillaceae TaxID=33958 RepID=UPI0020106576|nr:MULTISPECIES: hypothetical protein [Lactobacillaceae]UQB03635.1 hypothetical protein Ped0620_10335 [Pediococcus pentosaceus]